MESWIVGMVANAVISLAYFGIVAAIVVPLVRSRQLRANPLGGATAAIFFTCAVHHGLHSFHMVMPAFGLDLTQGLAMRGAWGWQLALWDVLGAVVGVYYWTLRRTYGSLMEGAQLFEDMRSREERALELNDNVLQGLVVAKMSLDLGQDAKAREALDTSIGSASTIISDLLRTDRREVSAGLLRRSAAVIAPVVEEGPDAASPEGDQTA